MSFKYVNPGYGALTGDVEVTTFENFTYSPITGVSFQKIGDKTQNEIIISTPQAFTTDIYGKFNLYFNGTIKFNRFSIGGYPADIQSTWYETAGIGVQLRDDYLYLCDDGNKKGTGIPIIKNSLNSIWFHLHKDNEQKVTSGSLIVNNTNEAFVSDKDTDIFSYSQFSLKPFFYISFPKGQDIYISGLIISDQYIPPKEEIIALPTISLETNMTAGVSGIYIANADNQTLFQSVNVSSLIESYGASSAITGISLVGNPAYKVGEGVANLTALSKAGQSIAKHDTFTLSGDSTTMIMDSWEISSVTTIKDLRDMQFGWKVGT